MSDARNDLLEIGTAAEEEREDLLVILGTVLGHLLKIHPLPWRIEEDWTAEVQDADGALVCKFSQQHRQQAARFIHYAEEHAKRMKEADTDLRTKHPDLFLVSAE